MPSVVDVSNIRRALNHYPDRVAGIATNTALTRTAASARKHIQEQIPKRFDRPTPFTLRAPRFKPATKAKPVAEVSVAPTQAGYLVVQETGGTRRPAKRALVVPVQERLNAYGNMPKGRLKRLLARKDTFSGRPSNRARPGIYQRVGGKRSRRLKLLVAYEPKAEYRPRFRFRESVEGHVKGVVAREFVKAFAEQSVKEASKR